MLHFGNAAALRSADQKQGHQQPFAALVHWCADRSGAQSGSGRIRDILPDLPFLLFPAHLGGWHPDPHVCTGTCQKGGQVHRLNRCIDAVPLHRGTPAQRAAQQLRRGKQHRGLGRRGGQAQLHVLDRPNQSRTAAYVQRSTAPLLVHAGGNTLYSALSCAGVSAGDYQSDQNKENRIKECGMFLSEKSRIKFL